MNPEIDFQERLRRSARIILASLSEEQADLNPPSKDMLNTIRKDIEASGLRVRRQGRG